MKRPLRELKEKMIMSSNNPPLKILILDDVYEQCVLVKHKLEHKHINIQVEFATHLKIFFQKLSEIKPDIILLDLNLDEESFSGLDILEFITTKIIIKPLVFIVSNERDQRKKIKCIELGADDVIQKPLNTDFLVNKIKGYFDQYHFPIKAFVPVPNQYTCSYIQEDITILSLNENEISFSSSIEYLSEGLLEIKLNKNITLNTSIFSIKKEDNGFMYEANLSFKDPINALNFRNWLIKNSSVNKH